MNPTKITIKFLNNILVGFPILPSILQGNNGFDPNKSTYKWEFGKYDDNGLVGLQTNKSLKKFNQEDNWTSCNNTDTNSPIYIPDVSKLNYILRLSCTPHNENGIKLGNTVSFETKRVTIPPITNFLFNEKIERMKIFKPVVDDLKQFRVVTYNILAENFAREGRFKMSPKESLPMDYRLPVLIFEIKEYQADIICIQEIDLQYYESHFKPYLCHECNMDGVISCKTNAMNPKDGIATFYNRTKFEFVESNVEILYEAMIKLPFFQQIHNEGLKNRLARRETELQLCVLKSIGSKDTFIIVANTHLYSDPYADHIRLLQTMTCISCIESKVEYLKNRFPKMKSTVIFCGDFNSPPTIGSIQYIESGKVHENHEDWKSHHTEKIIPGIEWEHKLNLTTSFPQHELTNIVEIFEGCIDYMFYQECFVQLCKTYPPSSKEKIAKICKVEKDGMSLPNFYAPSDHMPLIADFTFKNSK